MAGHAPKGFLVGTVGRRPDQFRVIAFVPLEHQDGQPRQVELKSKDGEFTLWLDGAQIGGPWAVPARLRGSSLHGVALDENQDPARTPDVPIVEAPFFVTTPGSAMDLAADTVSSLTAGASPLLSPAA